MLFIDLVPLPINSSLYTTICSKRRMTNHGQCLTARAIRQVPHKLTHILS